MPPVCSADLFRESIVAEYEFLGLFSVLEWLGYSADGKRKMCECFVAVCVGPK